MNAVKYFSGRSSFNKPRIKGLQKRYRHVNNKHINNKQNKYIKYKKCLGDNTWKIMGTLLLPVLIGLLFFITALSWNDAIVSTINFYSGERDFIKPTRQELIYKWVYTLIITFILIFVIYIFRKQLHRSTSNLETHTDAVINFNPEDVALSAEILPNLPVNPQASAAQIVT